jgi:hypothetical protein
MTPASTLPSELPVHANEGSGTMTDSSVQQREPTAQSSLDGATQFIQAKYLSEDSAHPHGSQPAPNQIEIKHLPPTTLQIRSPADERFIANTDIPNTIEIETCPPLEKLDVRQGGKHTTSPAAAVVSYVPSLNAQTETEHMTQDQSQGTKSSNQLLSCEPCQVSRKKESNQNFPSPVESKRQAAIAPAPEPIIREKQSTPTRTPQENTLAELKAQRAALIASLATLSNIQNLIAENQSTDETSDTPDREPTEAEITAAANKLVKDHIKLLHEYNEIKDVGQGLMGLIADQRGVRIVEVQDEFGLDSND